MEDLEYYDITNMKENANIFIHGRRGIGKSTLVKDIITKRNIKNLFIISHVERLYKFYSTFLDCNICKNQNDYISEKTNLCYKFDQDLFSCALKMKIVQQLFSMTIFWRI